MEIITNSAAETVELGKRIGALLKGGEVIALVGNLGTGKTHLIKGIAAGLGANESDAVSSPTFVLVNEYFGRDGLIHIYHIDAYRMKSVKEFQSLGFDEYCCSDSVVLVEWADKVMTAVEEFDPMMVRLEHINENQRRIVIENAPECLSGASTD
ncbi:MAG: tRNA (adenosine(37)-N6)-threonylcarbamoyltransferase complex ATPase subunit type 1 TsaE [Planctomycetales bacterium 4572_13]|nr:MAG: tRNA (adenosine(37)-N6)-threonylcarbamoyltransferase complex ATPase subunit type 1 TsaE [Planctomycetales bacterium 4572_13]